MNNRLLGTEGSALRGIQVFSPTDVWAVGQTQESNGAISTLTEHFNGTAASGPASASSLAKGQPASALN